MSTSYRVVRQNGLKAIQLPGIDKVGLIDATASFQATEAMEIRSSEGDIWRIKPGTSFKLQNTAEGIVPVIEGEAFSIIINSWHKSDSRTCHTCKLHSSPPVVSLVRPIAGQDASEYWALQGDFIIHEFDERGRHFVIADVEAGQHVTVTYKNGVPLRERYSTKTRALTDDEIDHLLAEYVDPRKWSL